MIPVSVSDGRIVDTKAHAASSTTDASASEVARSVLTDADAGRPPNANAAFRPLCIRLLFDVFNASQSSALDPACKVKPLYGYGRINHTFCLRQAGQFWVRACLEIEDRSADGSAGLRLNLAKHYEEEILRLAVSLRNNLECRAFYTYDTKTAKRQRCYAELKVSLQCLYRCADSCCL